VSRIESPDNSGARGAGIDRDPSLSVEEARDAEERVRSRSEPEPSRIPSSDALDPRVSAGVTDGGRSRERRIGIVSRRNLE
jgi:hypothetical protein